jgi:hypothetical protein
MSHGMKPGTFHFLRTLQKEGMAKQAIAKTYQAHLWRNGGDTLNFERATSPQNLQRGITVPNMGKEYTLREHGWLHPFHSNRPTLATIDAGMYTSMKFGMQTIVSVAKSRNGARMNGKSHLIAQPVQTTKVIRNTTLVRFGGSTTGKSTLNPDLRSRMCCGFFGSCDTPKSNSPRERHTAELQAHQTMLPNVQVMAARTVST